MQVKIFITLILTLLLSSSASADKILLKNGTEIECKIISETKEDVQFHASGTQMTIPRSTISRIEKDEEKPLEQMDADSLLAKKRYADAIREYRKELSAQPEKMREKIRAARQACLAEAEEKYGQGDPDEMETRLRKELRTPGATENSLLITRFALARLLMKKSTAALDRIQNLKIQEYLKEAWTLAPTMPGLVPAYVDVLKKKNPKNPEIGEVLSAWLKEEPDDCPMIEALVSCIGKEAPFKVLPYLYPNNTPHPKATAAMNKMLPEILLACFNAPSYPTDAPFDKASCCERLIALKPSVSPEPLLLYKIEIQPDSAANYYALGKYYLKDENFPKAIQALQKSTALQQTPETDEAFRTATSAFQDLQLTQAKKQLLEKHLVEAKKTCTDALVLVPENKPLAQLLGKIEALGICPDCQGSGIGICENCAGSGTVQTGKEILRKIFQPCILSELNPVITEQMGLLKSDFVVSNFKAAGRLPASSFKSYKCEKCGATIAEAICGSDRLLLDGRNSLTFVFEGGGKTSKISVSVNAKPQEDAKSGENMANAPFPSQCPKCLKSDGMIPEIVPCNVCKGSRRAGGCATCKNKGLVVAQKPTDPSVDLSEYQVLKTPPSIIFSASIARNASTTVTSSSVTTVSAISADAVSSTTEKTTTILEAERLAQEKITAETERLAKEKAAAETERLAKEKNPQEAHAKTEAERITKEKTAAETVRLTRTEAKQEAGVTSPSLKINSNALTQERILQEEKCLARLGEIYSVECSPAELTSSSLKSKGKVLLASDLRETALSLARLHSQPTTITFALARRGVDFGDIQSVLGSADDESPTWFTQKPFQSGISVKWKKYGWLAFAVSNSGKVVAVRGDSKALQSVTSAETVTTVTASSKMMGEVGAVPNKGKSVLHWGRTLGILGIILLLLLIAIIGFFVMS